jgi:CelD/BcsL family acetyltransferase involved in cellulose biosynthesis
MLRLEKIDSLAGLEKIKDDWQELVRVSPQRTPFLTYEWITNWWEHFGQDKELCVLIVREDQRPVVIAPLMKYRGPFHRRYLCIPTTIVEGTANYHSHRIDFICREFRCEHAHLIWTYLANNEAWHILRLYPLLADSPSITTLRDVIEDWNIRAVFTLCQSSPYLTLPEPNGGALDIPKLVLRYARKATKTGGFTKELITDRARLDEALLDVFRISEHGWAAKEGTALSSTLQLRQFYTKLARIAADHGWLFLAVLKFKDEPIAFEYNLVYDDTIYNLKLAFDQRYSNFAPGHVLKHWILTEARNRFPRVREYDMLGDADSYKLSWSQRTRRYLKTYVYSPKSRYARLLYTIQSAMRYHPTLGNKVVWTTAAS